jgi:hypothetical protein
MVIAPSLWPSGPIAPTFGHPRTAGVYQGIEFLKMSLGKPETKARGRWWRPPLMRQTACQRQKGPHPHRRARQDMPAGERSALIRHPISFLTNPVGVSAEQVTGRVPAQRLGEFDTGRRRPIPIDAFNLRSRPYSDADLSFSLTGLIWKASRRKRLR